MKATIKNTLNISDRLYLTISRFKGIRIETDLKPYLHIIKRIKTYNYKNLIQAEIKKQMHDFRKQFLRGTNPYTFLPAVFALVSEVCRRTLGLHPFVEQLVAAIVLAQQKLAQMQNGEGKTLAAVFPACLYALSGKGVHILTANDYLAKRDALWMGKIYDYFGITYAYLQEGTPQAQRKQAYQADITYLTAEQGGFDLLRDNRSYDKNRLVHREFHMAIVDEADFILVDQARVPLAIAGHEQSSEFDPYEIDVIVQALKPHIDFQIDKRKYHICLTVPGENKACKLLQRSGLRPENKTHLAAINVALYARYLLQRNVDYIVKRKKILPVDEVTGRVAEKKRWPYGIQRALQVKEKLALQLDGRLLGSITIENYIKLYPIICAMTATAVPAAEELVTNYGLNIVVIPPHLPVQRVDLPDLIFTNTKAKIAAIIAEIKRVHPTGQPLLIATTSVKESKKFFLLLKQHGVQCRVLNAKNPEREAKLIARAGMLGAVTVSTHMSGRGTDIKLGGERGEQKDLIAALGGLYIIGTHRHYSVRVDNQLRGRAGRQGDPGMSRFFISMQDQMMIRYGIHEFIPQKLLLSHNNESVSHKKAAREIARAQSIIEEQHSFMRYTLRRYSMLVELQRQYIQQIRTQALLNNVLPDHITKHCSRLLKLIQARITAKTETSPLVKIMLFYLDCFWADHLACIEDLKQGLYLHALAREEPLLVFIKQVSIHFTYGLHQVYKRCIRTFKRIKCSADIDLALQELRHSPTVWTYVINEHPLPVFKVTRKAERILSFSLFYVIRTLFVRPFVFLINKAKYFLKVLFP